MSRFQRPGRGSVLRAAFVLVLAALAAFAVGAVHGGAATPSMQTCRRARQGRPDRDCDVDRARSRPTSAHPTNTCNGAGEPARTTT